MHNLAVRLAPEYDDALLSNVTAGLAATSKGKIQRINSKKIIAHTELLELVGGGRHNIISDT